MMIRLFNEFCSGVLACTPRRYRETRSPVRVFSVFRGWSFLRLIGLCFVTLLTGCGVENKGNQGASSNDLQEAPQTGETQIATTSVAKPKVVFPKKHAAFLDAYCMGCHDADTEKGEVNLEALSFQIETIEQAETWQKVLSALNSGKMPPKKKKQPEEAEKADFLDDLSLTMVTARKVLSDSGGKITMRRLNKRDYQNSIESLLGVRLDTKLLPDDGSSGDFDTVGASLFLSSDKFEQYLKLGRHAIDEFYERNAECICRIRVQIVHCGERLLARVAARPLTSATSALTQNVTMWV